MMRLRLGSTAVGIVSFWVAVVAFVLVAIPLELGYRAEVADSRSVLFTEDEREARLAYRVDETSIGEYRVGIFDIEPLDSTIAPPPGMKKWIKPGGVAISQSLNPHREEIERQFGIISSVLDESVVLGDEALIYFRPRNHEEFIALARSGNGVYFSPGYAEEGEDGVSFGIAMYEHWAKLLSPLVLIVMVIPIVLALRATRAHLRVQVAREQFILQCIGARKGILLKYRLETILDPYLLGVLVALMGLLPFIAGIAPVPITGFYLHPYLYLDHALIVIPMFVGILFLVLLYLAYPQLSLSVRKRIPRIKLGVTGGLILFLLGIVLSGLRIIFASKIPYDAEIPIIVAIVVLFLMGIPAFMETLTLIVAHVRKRRQISELDALFNRWVAHFPEKASRSSAVTAVYIVIGVMFLAVFESISTSTRLPESPQVSLTAVQVSPLCFEDTPACGERAVKKISEQNSSVAIIGASYGSSSGIYIYTNGGMKPSVVNAYIDRELGPIHGNQRATAPPPSSRFLRLYVLSESDSNLLEKIQESDIGSVLPALSIPAGLDGLTLALIYKQQSTWLTLFTIMGFLVALGIVWLQYARDTRAQSRDIASIAALTGKTRTLANTLAMRSLLVNAVTGLAGFGLGVFFVRVCLGGTDVPFPFSFFFILGIAFTAVLLLQAVYLNRQIKYFASRWLPGKDHYEYSAV